MADTWKRVPGKRMVHIVRRLSTSRAYGTKFSYVFFLPTNCPSVPSAYCLLRSFGMSYIVVGAAQKNSRKNAGAGISN